MHKRFSSTRDRHLFHSNAERTGKCHIMFRADATSHNLVLQTFKALDADGSGAVDERRASSTRKASGVRKELGDVMNQKKSSFKKAE